MDEAELRVQPDAGGLLRVNPGDHRVMPQQPRPRDQILQHVWGYDYVGDTRTVDVHMRWLREKLEEDPANPGLFQTIRGVGYCLRW